MVDCLKSIFVIRFTEPDRKRILKWKRKLHSKSIKHKVLVPELAGKPSQLFDTLTSNRIIRNKAFWPSDIIQRREGTLFLLHSNSDKVRLENHFRSRFSCGV